MIYVRATSGGQRGCRGGHQRGPGAGADGLTVATPDIAVGLDVLPSSYDQAKGGERRERSSPSATWSLICRCSSWPRSPLHPPLRDGSSVRAAGQPRGRIVVNDFLYKLWLSEAVSSLLGHRLVSDPGCVRGPIEPCHRSVSNHARCTVWRSGHCRAPGGADRLAPPRRRLDEEA